MTPSDEFAWLGDDLRAEIAGILHAASPRWEAELRMIGASPSEVADRLRVRVRPGRHPYDGVLWGWEVYDPAAPPNHQNVTLGGWFDTWERAARAGCAVLADYRASHRPLP